MSNFHQPAQPALGSNSTLIPKSPVCAKLGFGNTVLYDKIAAGLCTSPVKVGARSSRWPTHEIDAIVAARMAGAGDDQVRVLVNRLHEIRQEKFQAVMAAVAA